MNTEQLQFFDHVSPHQDRAPRARSYKQHRVLLFLRDHQQMSVTDAVQVIGRHYYGNAPKHTGRVLSNMVRKGLLTRAKRGLYQLP